MFLANKEFQRKSGLYFCFPKLTLISKQKVLSYETFTVFFWWQKPPTEEMIHYNFMHEGPELL